MPDCFQATNIRSLNSFIFIQFSRSAVSDSETPRTTARQACLPPTLGAHSNSCPLSQWCHQITSSSVVPFSCHLQSFPASGYFPISHFFVWGGQSIGVSASASVLPMKIQDIQDWFPLGGNQLDFLAVQVTLKSLLQHHIYYTYIKLFVYNLVCCNKLFQYPPAASVCWDKPLRRSCVFLHILEAQTCWPSFASNAVCRQTTLWNRHSVSLWSKGRFTADKYINKDSAAFQYKLEASFLATPWKVWGFWSLHSCDVYYLRVQHPPKSLYHPHPPPTATCSPWGLRTV